MNDGVESSSDVEETEPEDFLMTDGRAQSIVQRGKQSFSRVMFDETNLMNELKEM